MIAIERTYKRVIFKPEVIKSASERLIEDLVGEEREPRYVLMIILFPDEQLTYDNEDEFFSDYRKYFWGVSFRKTYHDERQIYLHATDEGTTISIQMPSKAKIAKVMEIFEDNVESCLLSEPSPKIFIGHGHNLQWRDLKDHLHEKHKLDVEAYEIGARAGLTIKEVLDEMLTTSSFALLVLTGEDIDASGKLHARENVIHELGLFQGRLGWEKAIVLLEDGVSEFSNIHGLNQIRFSKGHVQETFGEVLATIRREFA